VVRRSFAEVIQKIAPGQDYYAPQIVDAILTESRRHHASDVHLVPGESGLRMQWRIDGVLTTVAIFDSEISAQLIARLKVLAGLLTYRTDVPQEGRIAREKVTGEVRVATFPTLYGEKAAIRLFADSQQLQRLQELGFSEAVLNPLMDHLRETAGVILLTGPSGSGKTTTAYACLREMLSEHGESRSVVTLEDPIEVAIPGVSQSQIRPGVGFDLATGLRSLMRQDPDVIFVGEIRDPKTAETVFQAALTGHLVLTTFHAGSAIEAVTRLLDMGIEPYLLRSTLRLVACQRLFRKLTGDAVLSSAGENSHTFADKTAVDPASYSGRFPLMEILDPAPAETGRAILDRADARRLATVAKEAGMTTLHDYAREAILRKQTTEPEVFRVLGRRS
jgi:general secretion pathway protein E